MAPPADLEAFAAAALSDPTAAAPAKEPLKIAYSDWPGWVAWEIAIKKGWFKEAGVEVKFEWMDYVASMEAYGAGKVDAVCMTNGDALVTGATAKPSVCIVINDFSNTFVFTANVRGMIRRLLPPPPTIPSHGEWRGLPYNRLM